MWSVTTSSKRNFSEFHRNNSKIITKLALKMEREEGQESEKQLEISFR